MPRCLAVLTLALVLLPPFASGQTSTWPEAAAAPGVDRAHPRPAAGDPVALSVRRGWACALQGEERRWFTTLDGSKALQEGFYLELGTNSEVELSWSGSASVRLQGPAGLFVEPAAQPFGGRLIGFRRVGVADFEVRRGSLTITLPRGQRLMPASGAFRLHGHAGGVVDLRHHAGLPIELDIGVRYTFPLPAGTYRRIPECVAPPLPTGPPRSSAAPSDRYGRARIIGER